MTDTRSPELRAIDLALTEHLFGWRWHCLTSKGIQQAEETTQRDGIDRSHMLLRQRFLSEPRAAELQVASGLFVPAPLEAPISDRAAELALPVSQSDQLAILVVQKCDYISYHKTDRHGHRVFCARTMGSAIGRGVRPTFSEATARAVALACIAPEMATIALEVARRELREELVEEGHERGV